MIKSVLFLIFLSLGLMTFGQSLSTSTIEKTLKSFYSNNYQESIFIHTDKSYYLTGETIKLAVYCTESLTSLPTQLSKVAYADIVDNNYNTILTARIEIKNGIGSGEIYIPTSVTSGYMILRGYTQWMRNFGPETFFHSVVTIINPFKKLPQLLTVGDSKPFISFYPEGGVLLGGIPAKVVFQGKSEHGQPQDITGYLITKDSAVVLSFASEKNGLGSFEFTPDPDEQYYARVAISDSSFINYPLPPVSTQGLSVRVSDRGSNFEISIAEKNNSTRIQLQVIVHEGATIFDSNTINNSENEFKWAINKSSLPTGIFYISVFRGTKMLVQRIVCNYPKMQASVSKLLGSSTVDRRSTISLNIDQIKELIDKLGASSISISDQGPELFPSPVNMQQWIIVKNAIAEPYGLGEYFEGSDEDISQRINNLLIAYPNQKAAVLFNSFDQPRRYLPECRSMLVTGHIFDKVSGSPAVGINTYLSIPGRNTSFFAAKSKTDGSLVFELKQVYGENEVVVQTDYTKDTTYRIEIDNPYSKDYMKFSLPEFTLNDSLSDWLVEKSQQMQVVNAYLKYNPSIPAVAEIDSSAFYFKPDASYMLDDYTRFIVMEEVMREYIAGVNVRKNRDGFRFMVVDMEKNIVYEDNPLMLLDGVPVFDADEIIALDPLKVQRIQTVNTRFAKGIVDCQGIVNYTTYKGNLTGFSLHSGALAFRYDGLQVSRLTPSIRYTTTKDINSRTPDFRNTIYWATYSNGKEFKDGLQEIFTSDATGSYKVTINALASDGKMVSVTDVFTVR